MSLVPKLSETTLILAIKNIWRKMIESLRGNFLRLHSFSLHISINLKQFLYVSIVMLIIFSVAFKKHIQVFEILRFYVDFNFSKIKTHKNPKLDALMNPKTFESDAYHYILSPPINGYRQVEHTSPISQV